MLLFVLSGVGIYPSNFLIRGVKIGSYNNHRSAPFLRACWLVFGTPTLLGLRSRHCHGINYTHHPIPDNRFDAKRIESSRNLSVTAFHEKAGRSQGNSGFIVSSWFFSLTKFFSHRVATVAMLPFALSRSDLVARCMLGVLNSAGAAICLATCHFT